MFDRYVAQTKPSWKRRALIVASIGLHGLAAIILVVWSFFHVDEIAPPALSLTFFSAAPPPPPPPPPPPKSSATHVEHKTTPKPTQVVQPTNVKPIIQPKEPEPKEEDSNDDGEEGGVEGGVKGGVKGGVVGGVIGGVVGGQLGGTGTGSGGPTQQPKMVASFTLLAQQLQHPDPHLPDWFKNQHAQQTVKGTYKVCLRTDGRVMSVGAMNGVPGLDGEISQQIQQTWVYKPQQVPICFVALVTFKIN